MKKIFRFDKKKLIILMIAFALIVNFAYGYAHSSTKQLQENVAIIKTPSINLEIESDDLKNSEITIKALEKKDININITNYNNKTVYYLLLHEKVNTGVMLYSNSDIDSYLESGVTKKITITIDNQTLQDEKIKLFFQCSYDIIINKDYGYSYINNIPSFDHSRAHKPMLDNSMIPVTYVKNSNNEGYYIKADVNNKNAKAIWYDYDNGIWANMVLIKKDKLSNYKDISAGEIINNEDILGYYVWIPKFRYIIHNYNNYNSYEVINDVLFENEALGTVVCEDVSKDGYFISEACRDSKYERIYENLSSYSHPAFKNNNGFWVSKFMMSSNGLSLPNVNPSKETLEEALKYARSMEIKDNIYGIANDGYTLLDNGQINGDNNRLTTKVLNNEEWGAITILSNSIYGKSGNNHYYDQNSNMFTKIYPNLNSHYTGCSSPYNINTSNFLTSPSTACIAYNDLNNYTHLANSINYMIGEVGPGASTTGTVYGVYDMVGGEREQVATVTMTKDNTLPITKYYDYVTTYAYNDYIGFINNQTNINNLYRYKLGDGIREFYRSFSDNGLWHNGYINHQIETGVFLRGGFYKLGKGASIYSVDISSLEEKYAYKTVIIVQ